MNASSSGTRRQLSGTQTAPSLASAKKLSMYSTLFICSSATRSPLRTPCAVERRRGAVGAAVPVAEGEAPPGVGVDEPFAVGLELGALGEEETDVVLHLPAPW